MKEMRINEIFYSIQGEGNWTGTPMVFIRFSGCNLQCDFCDTNHMPFQLMSIADILAEINMYSCRHVCLTGGEPGLQVTKELINALHRQGRIVHIETNGTKELPSGIDWVTVSPKMNEIILKKADEIKIVYQGQDVSGWEKFQAKHYYLQPCSCRNTNEVIDYIKKHPKWKLSLQTQKLLKIR